MHHVVSSEIRVVKLLRRLKLGLLRKWSEGNVSRSRRFKYIGASHQTDGLSSTLMVLLKEIQEVWRRWDLLRA